MFFPPLWPGVPVLTGPRTGMTWARLEVAWLVQHMQWDRVPSVLQPEGSVTGKGHLFSLFV